MTHAEDRAIERYGLELTPEDSADMIRQIEAGEAELLRDLGEGKQRWRVSWKRRGSIVRIVYKPKSKFIVTVLPTGKTALNKHKKRRPYREIEDDFPAQDTHEKETEVSGFCETETYRNDTLKAKLLEALAHV